MPSLILCEKQNETVTVFFNFVGLYFLQEKLTLNLSTLEPLICLHIVRIQSLSSLYMEKTGRSGDKGL